MCKIIYNNFYENILLAPICKDRCINRLIIVSGYATAAMSFHHLNHLRNIDLHPSVELICGMTVNEGISLSNHRGFTHLLENDFQDRFRCSYVYRGVPIHAKLYIWCNDNNPLIAYVGSANYSQTAMVLERQREIMIQCNPGQAMDFYNGVIDDTIFCDHNDISEHVVIYRDTQRDIVLGDEVQDFDYEGLENVTTQLLAPNGSQRSGLNWGQRPEYNREPNQAYIRLTADVYRTNFFPPRGTHFTVLTDDGKVLVCSRDQDNAKAIHTPHNNSLIGEYFRNRLNLQNGVPVLPEHLNNYGRNDVTFYKIDDETYYMDFSVR